MPSNQDLAQRRVIKQLYGTIAEVTKRRVEATMPFDKKFDIHWIHHPNGNSQEEGCKYWSFNQPKEQAPEVKMTEIMARINANKTTRNMLIPTAGEIDTLIEDARQGIEHDEALLQPNP
jgi:hypothetical protein